MMSNYQKIMVAIDFSDLSERAGRRAVELAGFYGAELVFVHVIEHFPDHLPHYKMAREDMDPQEFLVDRTTKDLEGFCDSLGCGDADRAVRLSKHSAKGELLGFADKNAVDLIVLGSHGRNVLNELLAGSTATGVVRGAKCDVLTVRRVD